MSLGAYVCIVQHVGPTRYPTTTMTGNKSNHFKMSLNAVPSDADADAAAAVPRA